MCRWRPTVVRNIERVCVPLTSSSFLLEVWGKFVTKVNKKTNATSPYFSTLCLSTARVLHLIFLLTHLVTSSHLTLDTMTVQSPPHEGGYPRVPPHHQQPWRLLPPSPHTDSNLFACGTNKALSISYQRCIECKVKCSCWPS